jgi:hypothetical protein
MVMPIVNIVVVLNFTLLCCIILVLIILLFVVQDYGLLIGCYGMSRMGVCAFFLFLGFILLDNFIFGMLLFSNKDVITGRFLVLYFFKNMAKKTTF